MCFVIALNLKEHAVLFDIGPHLFFSLLPTMAKKKDSDSLILWIGSYSINQTSLENTTAIHSLPLPLNAQVWIPHMAGSSYAIASRSMRICSIEFAGDKKIATNVDTIAKGKWPPIDLKCQEQSWYDLMISFLIWPCTAAWMCTLTLWCLREKVFPEIHYDVLMSGVCWQIWSHVHQICCRSGVIRCHQNKSPRLPISSNFVLWLKTCHAMLAVFYPYTLLRIYFPYIFDFKVHVMCSIVSQQP